MGCSTLWALEALIFILSINQAHVRVQNWIPVCSGAEPPIYTDIYWDNYSDGTNAYDITIETMVQMLMNGRKWSWEYAFCIQMIVRVWWEYAGGAIWWDKVWVRVCDESMKCHGSSSVYTDKQPVVSYCWSCRRKTFHCIVQYSMTPQKKYSRPARTLNSLITHLIHLSSITYKVIRGGWPWKSFLTDQNICPLLILPFLQCQNPFWADFF